MASPDPGASGSAPGVIGALRALAANALGIVRTRLELLANELEEERTRTLQIVVLGAIVLFCAAFGILLITAWLVVALWDQYRLTTLGVLALVYVAAAAVALRCLRAKVAARSKIFSTSLGELRRDGESLKSR